MCEFKLQSLPRLLVLCLDPKTWSFSWVFFGLGLGVNFWPWKIFGLGIKLFLLHLSYFIIKILLKHLV